MKDLEMFELTNPQKSIWVMEQFYKGTNINNICATLTINKEVDIEKLNKAINIFIKNNKSFGLNFKIVNGEIKQHFIEIEEIQFDLVRLKNKEDVHELGKQTAEEIFNVEDKHLFKFKIFIFENGYGGFVAMTHHMISDAATMSIIAKEIMDIYCKLINGEEIQEKEYSYRQNILDEKEYKNSEKFIKDRNYWKEKFATIPEVATIPSVSNISHANLTSKATREKFTINEY